MTSLEEKKLIKRITKGDTYAFEQIVRKYQNRIFTLSYRILANREEAEEITQDVFLKTYYSLRNFRSDSRLSTWIYRICYNESINRLKKIKKRGELVDMEQVGDRYIAFSDDAGTKMICKEEIEEIKKSIMKLHETERIIITLYYYEDMPVKEIAEITGKSVSNVKVLLYRSRMKLFDDLKDVVNQKSLLDYGNK